jgi:hypothetical protein
MAAPIAPRAAAFVPVNGRALEDVLTGVVAVVTPVIVSVVEAEFPAGSETVSVCVPVDTVVGIVKLPVPLPLELVLIVPSVTGELWSTIVNVSLPQVPESVTVIVAPNPTGFGVTEIATVQVTGP